MHLNYRKVKMYILNAKTNLECASEQEPDDERSPASALSLIIKFQWTMDDVQII